MKPLLGTAGGERLTPEAYLEEYMQFKVIWIKNGNVKELDKLINHGWEATHASGNNSGFIYILRKAK